MAVTFLTQTDPEVKTEFGSAIGRRQQVGRLPPGSPMGWWVPVRVPAGQQAGGRVRRAWQCGQDALGRQDANRLGAEKGDGGRWP